MLFLMTCLHMSSPHSRFKHLIQVRCKTSAQSERRFTFFLRSFILSLEMILHKYGSVWTVDWSLLPCISKPFWQRRSLHLSYQGGTAQTWYSFTVLGIKMFFPEGGARGKFKGFTRNHPAGISLVRSVSVFPSPSFKGNSEPYSFVCFVSVFRS